MTDTKVPNMSKDSTQKPAIRATARKSSEDRRPAVPLGDRSDQADRPGLEPEAPAREAHQTGAGLAAEGEAPAEFFQPVEESVEQERMSQAAPDHDRNWNPFHALAEIQGKNFQPQDAIERSVRLAQELTDLAKGSVEAMIVSSTAAVRVAEALGDEAIEYGRLNFQRASTSLRSLADAKSPSELLKFQSEHARSLFDDAVAESTRIQERVSELLFELADTITESHAATIDPTRARAA